jgi:hypothetical protein
MKRFTSYPALFGRLEFHAESIDDDGQWRVALMLLPSEAVRMAFALLWGAACTVVRTWWEKMR